MREFRRSLTIASLKEMRAFARALAPILRRGDLLFLWGDLGAGKTEFSRGLIRCLSGESEQCAEEDALPVLSPTFPLIRLYSCGTLEVAHCDFYRISEPAELEEIGFFELLDTHLVLVEWPERFGDRPPTDRLDLFFTYSATPEDSGEERQVLLRGSGDWASRLFACRTLSGNQEESC